jgi:hypothetical protein
MCGRSQKFSRFATTGSLSKFHVGVAVGAIQHRREVTVGTIVSRCLILDVSGGQSKEATARGEDLASSAAGDNHLIDSVDYTYDKFEALLGPIRTWSPG